MSGLFIVVIYFSMAWWAAAKRGIGVSLWPWGVRPRNVVKGWSGVALVGLAGAGLLRVRGVEVGLVAWLASVGAAGFVVTLLGGVAPRHLLTPGWLLFLACLVRP